MVKKIAHNQKRTTKSPAELTEKKLKDAQAALLNILEDTEEARKSAEAEKDKTRVVITHLLDGLLVFNQQKILDLINPQAERFFAIRSEDIIGKALPELAVFPALKGMADFLGEEIKSLQRAEFKPREDLILEVTTVPLARGDKNIGVLIILHDVTREKSVEKMKSDFVSLAAHQLRTPLSAIKWTLKMLLDEDLGKITEEQRAVVGKTYQSNERMIELINDLLDVTRIEEGRYLYKPQLAQIGDIIKLVVNSVRGKARGKNIGLEFQKPLKPLPRVRVDTEKLQLAIQNIVDNAIRYTDAGGNVTISVKYATREIEILVRDNGIGIPEDQQKRIFSKFFRGANAQKVDTEGSGLGLYIAKNIIEAHGGKIWFESKEGAGTAFHLTIPIREEFEEFLKRF